MIQEALDGTPLPEEARRHVEACEACGRLAAGLTQVEAFLAEKGDLAWSGSLTEGVLRGIRRQRTRGRWLAAAAAVLLAAAAWIGAGLLPEIPAMADAGQAVAERIRLPESPSAVLDSIAEGLSAVGAEASSVAKRSPLALGAPVALAALLLLLLLNGLVIGRPLLARRRHG
jgi:hypothetical protein